MCLELDIETFFFTSRCKSASIFIMLFLCFVLVEEFSGVVLSSLFHAFSHEYCQGYVARKTGSIAELVVQGNLLLIVLCQGICKHPCMPINNSFDGTDACVVDRGASSALGLFCLVGSDGFCFWYESVRMAISCI